MQQVLNKHLLSTISLNPEDTWEDTVNSSLWRRLRAQEPAQGHPAAGSGGVSVQNRVHLTAMFFGENNNLK